MTFEIKVNGEDKAVDADGDIPLLWILRDVLALTGTKFGCGIGQCVSDALTTSSALSRGRA